MRRTLRLLGTLLVLVTLAACDAVDAFPADRPEVEAAWNAYHEAPSHDTYLGFLKTNGRAAHAHADHHDVTGIRYQLRALDVQTAEAERVRDTEIAWLVLDRVREMEEAGHLELYEEVLPGSGKRFRTLRDRCKAVLDE